MSRALECPLTAFADDRSARGLDASKARTLAPALVTVLAVLGAGALTLLMFWPRLVEVWRHDAFYDPDDAMRLVQVRALLAGQSWFDMTAYRLDPPGGGSMHWSRVVDVPLVALIKAFGLFTDPATAERLTRIVFPTALLLALYAGIARLADCLLGAVARVPAIVTALFCGCAIVQFQPGRITHHAPRIVLLVFMTGAALEALDPAKARRAGLAGILAALSLAISLESLPFIACLSGMIVAIWAWRGRTMNRMLRSFAIGLAGGLLPCFAATVGRQHWFDPVCDALGAAHLGAGLIGAVGCLALATASRVLPGRGPRFAAAGALFAVTLAYVAFFYPDCLHDPFAKVDPLVRAIWLSNVTESRPLLRLFREDPSSAILSGLPVALGFCGCLVAAVMAQGLVALRFLVLSVLIAVGLAMAFWQVRVFTSVAPLAVCGALPIAVAIHNGLRRRGRDLAAILALCLVFPFTSLAWALVLPEDGAPSTQKEASAQKEACLAPLSFAPLAALPPGRVAAPIDAGSHLLVHTGLSVFAAPYHRNDDGNRFVFESFMAAPDTAKTMLTGRETTYLMICPGFGETQALAKRVPDGLAAALLAGRIPAWLAPVPVAGTPYRVFKLVAETP